MKKVLSVVLMCVVAIALVGCGATPLTQNQVDLQEAKYTAQGKCYERLKLQDAQLTTLLSRVPNEQMALVVVLQGMQENNKALMAIATGNDYNPCADGASAFDVQIAEITEKNKALASGIKDGTGLGKWIVGGWTISNVVDKVGQTTVTGDNNEINQNAKNSKIDAGDDVAGVTTYNSSSPSNSETTNTDSQNVYNEPDAVE